jgi:hypothetical protein
MRTLPKILLISALAAMVALPWLLESEEQKILARLDTLRTLAEIDSPESGIEQASTARQIGDFFTPFTVFDLTSAGYGVTEIASRQELVQKTLRGRAMLSALELSLDRPRVTLEGDSARVEVRASALGSRRDQSGEFLDIHLIEVLLTKQQGNWLVSGARHIRDERREAEAGRAIDAGPF